MSMEVILDPDVQAVAEFMQRQVSAARLVTVAEGVCALAPILWGQYGSEGVTALRLREPAITASPDDLHTR